MKRKHISITKELEKQLKQYAEKTGLKEAEIIRQALDAYFDKSVTNDNNARKGD